MAGFVFGRRFIRTFEVEQHKDIPATSPPLLGRSHLDIGHLPGFVLGGMAGQWGCSQKAAPGSSCAPGTTEPMAVLQPGPVLGSWCSVAASAAPSCSQQLREPLSAVPAGSAGELEESSPATGRTPGSQPAAAAKHSDSWHKALSLNYSSFPLRGLPYSSNPSVWWCSFRIMPFVSDVNFGRQQQTWC